jgi:hypothetical protein
VCCRLPGSGSGSGLSELQLLVASRRAAAAAAGAVLPPGAGGAAGPAGAAGGGVAVPPPPPHHPPGPDFHPAYRLNPYMEHLYSSLQQHSSPTASIHGQCSSQHLATSLTCSLPESCHDKNSRQVTKTLTKPMEVGPS